MATYLLVFFLFFVAFHKDGKVEQVRTEKRETDENESEGGLCKVNDAPLLSNSP